jgi:K+-transporting ATPase c subunit
MEIGINEVTRNREVEQKASGWPVRDIGGGGVITVLGCRSLGNKFNESKFYSGRS